MHKGTPGHIRLPHRLQGQKVKSQGGAGAYCGGDLAAQLVKLCNYEKNYDAFVVVQPTFIFVHLYSSFSTHRQISPYGKIIYYRFPITELRTNVYDFWGREVVTFLDY